MAADYDVAARMAQGRPALANLQHYVSACHQLGYQHPDLTLHAAQLGDWYRSEDGMNLAALQNDWTALEDAARASQDALALQDRQLAAHSSAWQGAGAAASRDFLRRHGEAAASAVASVRSAMEALGVLRESLWRAVDAKVDAVVAIEARAQPQRADWLAAATTVTTGVGDRSVAAELVDQAVKPFVDGNIRLDWLAAMHTATTSVTEAYGRAVAEISAERRPTFEIPDDLGPTWSPPPVTPPPGPAASVMTLPSAWSPTPVAAAAPTMPMPPPAEQLAPAPAQAGPALPSTPPLAGMGSGATEFGSGLAGLGQNFADLLGGLLGGAGNSVPEPPDIDVPEFDDPLSPEVEETDEPEEPDETDDEDEDEGDDAEAGDEVLGEIDGDPVGVAVDSAPAPPPAPPPAEPLPFAEPAAAEQTPCAIAADELPQVGDPPEQPESASEVSGPGAG